MKKIWTANRVRLERARAQIEALVPERPKQKRLKRMLLAVIPILEEKTNPGMEEYFEAGWEMLERCRATWATPEVWATPETPSRVVKGIPRPWLGTTAAASRRPAAASRPSGRETPTSAS